MNGIDWQANAKLIAAAPTMRDGITLAASRLSNIMDGFEPGTPLWTELQKVLFGLYGSLPKEPPEGQAA